MHQNTIKRKLINGQPSLGVSVMFPSPQIVEMIGKLGFDWVLIDCEHGSISPENVELMAMAAEATGIIPIARPPENSPGAILNVMERGVMGVQVPHVNNPDDAKRAVEAVKFHPLGNRSVAAGTRPADYGLGGSMVDYVTKSNQETIVCIQLEEQQALDNLDLILQVEEVDVFFVGPSDLSQSMGFPGQPEAPEVVTAMANAFAKITAAGKSPGSAGKGPAINSFIGQGVQYIYTHLPVLLEAGSTKILDSVSKQLGSES